MTAMQARVRRFVVADKKYSEVGTIVRDDAGQTIVYHVDPDEFDAGATDSYQKSTYTNVSLAIQDGWVIDS